MFCSTMAIIILMTLQHAKTASVTGKNSKQVMHAVEALQLKASITSYVASCPSGSIHYGGTCFFYRKNVKVPWRSSAQACANLSSLAAPAIFTGLEEFITVSRHLASKLLFDESKVNNSDIKGVSLHIGLKYDNLKDSWLWSNGSALSEGSLADVWWPGRLPYSRCGIMVVYENGQTLLSDSHCDEAKHVLCKITRDQCYERPGRCGWQGTCISIPFSFVCRCSYFHAGPSCERWSTQGVQALLGLLLSITLWVMSKLLGHQSKRKSLRSSSLIAGSNVNKPEKADGRSLESCENGFHLMPASANGVHFRHDLDSLDQRIYSRTLERPTRYSYSAVNHRVRDWTGFKRKISEMSLVGVVLVLTLTTVVVIRLMQQRQQHIVRTLPPLCRHINSFFTERLIFLPLSCLFVILTYCSRAKARDRMCFSYTRIAYREGANTGFPLSLGYRSMFHLLTAFEIIHGFNQILLSIFNMNIGILVDLTRQIGVVILLGIRYYPVRIALERCRRQNVHSIVTLILAMFYMWANLCMIVYQEAACKYSFLNSVSSGCHRSLMKLCPLLLALYVICLRVTWWLGCDMVQMVRSGCLNKSYQTVGTEKTDDIVYETYIRDLLLSRRLNHRRRDADHSVLCVPASFRCSRLSRLIATIFSARQWEVGCPPVISSTYIIAFVLIFYLTITVFEFEATVAAFINAAYQRLYVRLSNITTITDGFGEKDPKLSLVEGRRDFSIAAVLCFCLHCVQLTLSLRSTQFAILRGYQGKSTKADHPQPPQVNLSFYRMNSLLVRSFHYPGLVLGHLIWSYVFTYLILFCLILTARLLARMTTWYLVDHCCRMLLPVIVVISLKHFLMHLITRLCFVRIHPGTVGPSKLPELRNMTLMSAFIYFNLFFDCMTGVLSCFLRMTRSMFVGTLYLARLDSAAFQGNNCFDFMDPGFNAFKSFVHIQSIVSNPVLISFCQMISKPDVFSSASSDSDPRRKRNRSLMKSWRGSKLPQSLTSYRRKIRARTRWFLAYTLIYNRQLVHRRKHKLNVYHYFQLPFV